MNNENPSSLPVGTTGSATSKTEAFSLSGITVNFSKARKLPNTGATCDIYEYRYGNKRFLIKRIKKEDEGKPVILNAFQKEFEIGISLDHKGLPIYRSIDRDYIVMDYVDGKTLSAMIAERDPWLKNPANIRRMLMQLVDVIDYLHQKNVVHCDVKCDNVMITTGTRNAVLIDLGEAYTFADESHSGDPRVYGLDLQEDIGSPDIDFHGLGMIVDRLVRAGFPCGKFTRFRKLCYRRGVTSEQLLAALKPHHYGLIVVLAVAIISIITAAIFLLIRPAEEDVTPATEEAPAKQDTVVIVNEPPTPEQPEPSVSTSTLPKTATPDYKSIIEKELTGYFKPVEDEIAELERLISSGTATDMEITDQVFKLADCWHKHIMKAYETNFKRFPEIGQTEIQMAVADSKAAKAISRQMNAATKASADEMKRRHPELYKD